MNHKASCFCSCHPAWTNLKILQITSICLNTNWPVMMITQPSILTSRPIYFSTMAIPTRKLASSTLGGSLKIISSRALRSRSIKRQKVCLRVTPDKFSKLLYFFSTGDRRASDESSEQRWCWRYWFLPLCCFRSVITGGYAGDWGRWWYTSAGLAFRYQLQSYCCY